MLRESTEPPELVKLLLNLFLHRRLDCFSCRMNKRRVLNSVYCSLFEFIRPVGQHYLPQSCFNLDLADLNLDPV